MSAAVAAVTERVMAERKKAHVAVVAAWHEDNERRKEQIRLDKERRDVKDS